MVQLLPKDDAFAYGPAGADNYGTFLCNYLGCRISVTGTVPFLSVYVHDAYQTTDQSTGIVTGNAAFTHALESVLSQSRPRCSMWRAPFAADVVVSSRVLLSLQGGIPTYGQFGTRGVACRINGGTQQGNGGVTIRYENVNCYAAVLRALTPPAGFLLELWRVNAGAQTVLLSVALTDAQVLALNLLLPGTITLDCRTNAGNVDLIGTFSGLGSVGAVTLNVTDSSASKILSVGRCGFIMGRDRVNATLTATVLDLCQEFSVSEVVGGVPTLRLLDNFVRYQLPGYGLTPIADQLGRHGRWLSGSFYWDQFTKNTPLKLGRDTGAERLQWTFAAGETDQLRLAISSRPATDIRSQHRSAVFQISAQPASGSVGVGICLRASQPDPIDTANAATTPDAPGFTGYLASCIVTTGGVTTPVWVVYAFQNGIGSLYAQFNDTGSAHWPGYAVNFTMDLEVFNRAESTLNGPSVIKLKIDKGAGLVQVPLVLGTPPSGVAVDASGTVTDASAVRIVSGAGEGFAFLNTAGATVNAKIDTWTEQALTSFALPDNDQLSVSFAGEGTAVGSINSILAPDYTLEVVEDHFSLRFEKDSGHVQTLPMFKSLITGKGLKRQTIRFRKQGATPAQLASLLTFWADHSGSVTPFNFTFPDGSATVKAHIVEDTLDYELSVFGSYTIVFTLETLN